MWEDPPDYSPEPTDLMRQLNNRHALHLGERDLETALLFDAWDCRAIYGRAVQLRSSVNDPEPLTISLCWTEGIYLEVHCSRMRAYAYGCTPGAAAWRSRVGFRIGPMITYVTIPAHRLTCGEGINHLVITESMGIIKF